MSESDFIFDVDADTFSDRVIERSQELPVLVDFWAAWCEPCRVLMPLLARLAEQYQGGFLLAKVDTDAEQQLAAQYGVRSLPTVEVFRHGQIVEELVGVQPERAYRGVIDRYIVRESDRVREWAMELHGRGESGRALQMLREAAADDPDNDRITPDLVTLLMHEGLLEEAQRILNSVPMNKRDEEPMPVLRAKLGFLRDAASTGTNLSLQALRERVQEHPEDLEARRMLAVRQAADADYPAAMEQFLEIMKRDKNFADAAGQKGLVELFRIVGENHPEVVQARKRMAQLLY